MRKLTDEDLKRVQERRVIAGFEIINARLKYPKYSDSENYGIALGKNKKGIYVTWEFHYDDFNNDYTFYWGHYKESEEAALQDFWDRDKE